MNTRRRLVLCAGYFFVLAVFASAADNSATNRVSPVLRVPKGFRADLVVAAPRIANPTALTFDENGRLFVLEQPAAGQTGRIRLLEDADGDGNFETNVIFATDLAAPTALIPYKGGLFVATGANVLYLKDTNSDGVADVREVSLNDLNAAAGKTNGTIVIRDFVWGTDNRIHAAGAGFSFDLRTLTAQPEPGEGARCLCFDNHGRAFFGVENGLLQTMMFDARYAAQNIFLPPPAPVQSLAASDPSIRITGSSLIYRGAAFPTNYAGNLFVADPGTRSIHRYLLAEKGLEFTISRGPAESGADLLTASDPEFTPLQIVSGPDGAVYIVDAQGWHATQGRIWRIVPERFASKPPRLGAATTYDLAATLAQPDGWRRDTAARLLCERRDPTTVTLLSSMLAYAKNPLARFYALQLLDAFGALTERQLLSALKDTDACVRERGVLLAEKFLKNGTISPSLWDALAALGRDDSLRVRYQLALTLGRIAHVNKAFLLAGILLPNPGDRWMQAAVFSALAHGAGDVFVELASDEQFCQSPAGMEFLRQLAGLIGVQNQRGDVDAILRFIEETPLEAGQAYVLLRDLGNGLRRAGSSFAEADPQRRLAPLYRGAVNTAIAEGAPALLREQAIRFLEVADYTTPELVQWLALVVSPGEPPEAQVAAVRALARFNNQRVAGLLLQRRGALSPALRGEIIAALLTRATNAAALMAALENGRLLRPEEFSSVQINFLRAHSDPDVSAQAGNLFGEKSARHELAGKFISALKLQGSAQRGRELFTARCAACHEPGRKTASFGPPLAFAPDANREKIFSDILDPNAAISPGYATYVLETRDGEQLIGLVGNPDALVLLLRQSDGKELLLPQTGLRAVTRQNWSLMPEEASDGLSGQDLADLIEYVAGLR